MSAATEDTTPMDTTTEDVVGPSSQDLFERMLEEQLKREGSMNPFQSSNTSKVNTSITATTTAAAATTDNDDPMGGAETTAATAASSSSGSGNIKSANWKDRADAYDRLVTTLSAPDASDEDFADNEQYLSQCATEKNFAALEKGLQVVLCFVTHYKQATRTASEIVPLVIKAYPSTKQSVVKLVNDILLMYTEIDCGSTVLEQLLFFGQVANEKNPKTRSLSIQGIALLLRSFGHQVVAVKSILPKMPQFLSEVNLAVKTQATELMVELYRWLRDSITTIMDTWELKPAQKKDILSLFEKESNSPAPTPSRTVRSGKTIASAAVSSGKSTKTAQQDEFDPMDLLEPQEVLSKIPKEFDSELASAKWAERKKALSDVFDIFARYPKLKPGDYYPLMSKLVLIVDNDKNTAVVKQAIEVCEQLSKGLRSHFTYAHSIVPSLFQKFKDKKLIDAASKAIDAIDQYSQPIEDFVDKIQPELDLKANAVSKHGVITLLDSCFSRKKHFHVQAHKAIAAKLTELSDDANAGVREGALKLLGRLKWLGGDSAMSSMLSKLDKARLDKVTQAFESFGPPPVGAANVASSMTFSSSSSGSAPDEAPPKRPTTGAKPAAAKKPVANPVRNVKSSISLPSTTTMSSSTTRPPSTSASSRPASTKTTSRPTAKKPAQQAAPEEEEVRMSKEEVIEKASELIAPSIVTGLTSAKWNERTEALKELETFINESSDAIEVHGELLVRYMGYVPGWSESNLQVITKLTENITLILSKSKTFSKGALVTAIDGITEKLATAKAKDAGKVCLTAIAELLNPQFPFAQLYKKLNGHKNPKIIAEGITWMASAVEDFGVSYLRVDQLIDFIKSCLENTNPAVKKNSTALLCEMRKYMGDGLLDFLNDVKPALLTSIKSEFDKMPPLTNVMPTKQIRGVDAQATSGGSSGAGGLGDLPRTDIKPRISSKILKNLDDGNWKNRLAAVNEIEDIINEANKRIQPTLSELINALKKRLDDPNVKTLTTTLSLLILIGNATGPPVEKYCKLILPNIIAKLSHNNKAVRTLSLSVLESWVEIITLEPMLKFLPKGLSSEKGHPEGRKDVLTFIHKHLPTIKQRDATTFEPIVKTIIESIQDPKPETRKVAEQILPEIIAAVGVDEVRKHCRDLKPAFRQTLNAILDKYVEPVAPPAPTATSNQPEAARILSASLSQLPTPLSNAMEIDDDNDDERQMAEDRHAIDLHQPLTSATSSFKQPRTVVRRPVVEPSSVPDSCLPSTSSSGTNLGDVAMTRLSTRPQGPVLNIAELDESTPIPIPKLIDAIQVERGGNENTINALKKLVEILNNDRRAVVPHVKELVDCLTTSIQLAFELASAGLITIRLCKYLLNTKMILFSKRNIMELIDKETLQNLINQLLTRLLDEKLPLLEDGQNLLRAFNQLMINILQNSNRTSTYTSLLNLLATSHDKPNMKKYTELVVKCLLKLTKALESTVDRIQIDILLMDLHEFLTANPPTQFKNKDDLPLRTVKTILNELVKVKGPSIRTHLSFIPTHKNPLIVSYIELMLTNAQRQRERAQESHHHQDPGTIPSETMTEEYNEMLNDIFNCISNKDTCNTGLFRLYKFKKTYPSANINAHLSRCSEVFQVYIKRQLAKIEEHENRSAQENNNGNNGPSTKMQSPSYAMNTTSHKSSYTLSSMDAIRAEVKRRQQEMQQQQQQQQQGGVDPQALSRSLSVQDIRRRFREVKVNSMTDLEAAQSATFGLPATTMDQPLSTVSSSTSTTTTSSEQLEALKNRIRNKARQQQAEDQRRRSSSMTQSADTASLRARLAATQAKFGTSSVVGEEEKENHSDLINLRERLARLN